MQINQNFGVIHIQYTFFIGNVPCPVIYGAVVDSTCLFWEDNCGEPGACRLYDPVKFRMMFHGLTAIIMLGAFFVDALVCYKASSVRFHDDEVPPEEAKPLPLPTLPPSNESAVWVKHKKPRMVVLWRKVMLYIVLPLDFQRELGNTQWKQQLKSLPEFYVMEVVSCLTSYIKKRSDRDFHWKSCFVFGYIESSWNILLIVKHVHVLSIFLLLFLVSESKWILKNKLPVLKYIFEVWVHTLYARFVRIDRRYVHEREKVTIYL